jgi:hypothetical protein
VGFVPAGVGAGAKAAAGGARAKASGTLTRATGRAATQIGRGARTFDYWGTIPVMYTDNGAQLVRGGTFADLC